MASTKTLTSKTETPSADAAAQAERPVIGETQLAVDPNFSLKQRDPYLGFIAPQSGVGKEINKIGTEFGEYRRNAIEALPGFFVNRSSNFIASLQLTGEAFMFKAANNDFFSAKKLKNGKEVTDIWNGRFQNWLSEKHPDLSHAKGSGLASKAIQKLNPVIEPVYNIVSDAASTAGFKFKAKDLLRPGFYKESVESFTSLEKATKLDKARLPKGAKLTNSWQTRGVLINMVGFSVAALLPDDKDKPEDIENLAEMQVKEPLKYVAHRAATALNPLKWWDNKRAFAGLTMTVTGVCSFLSGFRNVNKHNAYYLNKAHGLNGLITATAGSQLFLAPSSDQGWGRFGTIMLGRWIFLKDSIMNRYKGVNKDPGRHAYAAGQGTFQTMNLSSFMIGGAEKLEDGTIIDHKSIRDRARKEAKLEKLQEQLEKEAAEKGISVDEVAARNPKLLALKEKEAAKNTGDQLLDEALEKADRSKPEKTVSADQLRHDNALQPAKTAAI